ncbi:MAG: ornithine carbamoyltransferase [Phycisphaeraceae bacterium]
MTKLANPQSAIRNPQSSAVQHFITVAQTPTDVLMRIFDEAYRLRDQRIAGKANEPILKGKTLAMIFEKPSLRTNVSFQQAMFELGGTCIPMVSEQVGLGKRESPADVARVLAGMVHGIMARVFEHHKLVELAEYSTVPVINALSDFSHPCQALADAMTMMDEFGRDLKGRTLTFVGDGNNVAHSLAVMCGRLGMNFVLASPPGYEITQEVADTIMGHCPDLNMELMQDPIDAVRYADAVYADTWISMGQETEAAIRKSAFEGFQINDALLAKAPQHCIVLHCLPAYRGIEITDSVMDGPRSRVFPQAHNRLHAQKGLLAVLMGGR